MRLGEGVDGAKYFGPFNTKIGNKQIVRFGQTHNFVQIDADVLIVEDSIDLVIGVSGCEVAVEQHPVHR